MFHNRMVWNNPEDVSLLRSKGLLTRIYAPQVRPWPLDGTQGFRSARAEACLSAHVCAFMVGVHDAPLGRFMMVCLRDGALRTACVWISASLVAWMLWCMRQRGLHARQLTALHALQLIMRQEALRLAQSVPRRSEDQQAADRERRAQPNTLYPFRYADDAPGGKPTTCEQFLASDSSMNILELMGPLPEPDDTRDSDRVLISRMTAAESGRRDGVQEPPSMR